MVYLEDYGLKIRNSDLITEERLIVTCIDFMKSKNIQGWTA